MVELDMVHLCQLLEYWEGHHAPQVGIIILPWFPLLFDLDKLIIAKEGQDTKLVESCGRRERNTTSQHRLPTWLLNDNFITLSLPNLLCLNGILFYSLNIFLYWPSGSMRIFDLNDYGEVALRVYSIKMIMAKRKYLYTRWSKSILLLFLSCDHHPHGLLLFVNFLYLCIFYIHSIEGSERSCKLKIY